MTFRLRALTDTVSLHYGGRRGMIVAHQVVVLCMRYVIENLTEAEILAIDKAGDIANCAITECRFAPQAGRDGNLVLARYNVAAPLVAEATPVTAAPDEAEPLSATLWAVWLHGEAGRRCAGQLGPLSFLGRELLAHIPWLLRGV